MASTTVSSVDLDGKPKAKGPILFTGPDGINDHRVAVESEQYYIGHGTRSPESTSDVTYLCRAPLDAPHPLAKSSLVGAVGWGVPGNVDHSVLKTGHQIKLKEFRSAVEDRHTHLYQTPYYDPPLPSITNTDVQQKQPTTVPLDDSKDNVQGDTNTTGIGKVASSTSSEKSISVVI